MVRWCRAYFFAIRIDTGLLRDSHAAPQFHRRFHRLYARRGVRQDGALAVFTPSDVITHTQSSWGANPTGTNAASLLLADYSSTYTPFGFFEVGISGTAGYSILFTNGIAVNDYLPATGIGGPLTGDLFNPSLSMSGWIGGEVVALQLNVDFSDAGVLHGNLEFPFGDLQIQDLASHVAVNGMTVREFVAELNVKLGGGAGALPDSIVELGGLAQDINNVFAEGTVQQFARDHLRLPPSTNGDFITYPQAAYGAPAATDATDLLQNHYAAISTLGSLGIGSGKTIFFNSPDAVRNFLPQTSPPGQLTDTIVSNPLTTSAGSFAGEVLALRLNVGFSDTGYLGDAGIPFGDLRIHNVPELGPGLNFAGVTVRELYDIAGSVLGGQSAATYFTTIASLNSVSAELNRAFGGGYVTDWCSPTSASPATSTPTARSMGPTTSCGATAWAPSTPKAITKPGEARTA